MSAVVLGYMVRRISSARYYFIFNGIHEIWCLCNIDLRANKYELGQKLHIFAVKKSIVYDVFPNSIYLSQSGTPDGGAIFCNRRNL